MAHWLETEILCGVCLGVRASTLQGRDITCPHNQRPVLFMLASAVTIHHTPTDGRRPDLIVVDDLDSNTQDAPGPSNIAADAQPTQATTGRPQRAATLRARRQSSPANSDSADTTSARPMRSSAKNPAAPKLKI